MKRIQRKRTKGERRDYVRKWLKSQDRPRAKCHGDKPHRARGMCAACYDRWLYSNSKTNRATKLRNAAKWKAANPAKLKRTQRANHLRKRYGIDESDYQLMLASQKGKCAICFRGNTTLHVDHCHTTGTVRGLLCLRCNGSLAWVEEILRKRHSTWFSAAKEYLASAKKNSKT